MKLVSLLTPLRMDLCFDFLSLKTLSVTQFQRSLQCCPLFLPALSDTAADRKYMNMRMSPVCFSLEPIPVCTLSQLTFIQRFHSRFDPSVLRKRWGFFYSCRCSRHAERNPTGWGLDFRMGQRLSVPADMDQTAEVLSTVSGRVSVHLSGGPEASSRCWILKCFSVVGSFGTLGKLRTWTPQNLFDNFISLEIGSGIRGKCLQLMNNQLLE